MNIGIVTYWFERGASYVSRAYKSVLEQQHNVFIYARGGESYARGNSMWDNKKVTWDTHYYSRIATYINLDLFKEWLIENKIELVIFNEQHWWMPILLCKKLKVKTGAYIDYYTHETVPFFMAYDFLICNTKRHYSVFQNHDHCIYIPWGTDLNIFKPTSNVSSRKEVTFFHSAGYSPDRKGTDTLLRAFNQLKTTSAKLKIHCQLPLVSFFPEMVDIIDKLQRDNRLEVIEKTVTAPGLYHLGDVYVYPTRLEGIGLTIIEALACSLPVITSDNGPMNEFITNETGRLIKIDYYKNRSDNYYWPECYCNVDDLAEKMAYYIENTEIIKIQKLSARQFALNNLDFTKNASVLNQKLQEIEIVPIQPILENAIIKYEKSRFNFIWRRKFFSPLWYVVHKLKPRLKKLVTKHS
jgi:1,2-diacylglycerol 3-alpha-glucosyltransferase